MDAYGLKEHEHEGIWVSGDAQFTVMSENQILRNEPGHPWMSV
jgi:hypothetical protein